MRMHGMWRWVGIASNVMCVVFVLGLAGLYVRQLSHRVSIGYTFSASEFAVDSEGGFVRFIYFGILPGGNPEGWFWFSKRWDELDYEPQSSWWFDWSYIPPNLYAVAIPVWFLMLLLAIKPTWSFVTWRRKHRRLRNDDDHPVCANCGYDLHGITSGKCPECGALF